MWHGRADVLQCNAMKQADTWPTLTQLTSLDVIHHVHIGVVPVHATSLPNTNEPGRPAWALITGSSLVYQCLNLLTGS